MCPRSPADFGEAPAGLHESESAKSGLSTSWQTAGLTAGLSVGVSACFQHELCGHGVPSPWRASPLPYVYISVLCTPPANVAR